MSGANARPAHPGRAGELLRRADGLLIQAAGSRIRPSVSERPTWRRCAERARCWLSPARTAHLGRVPAMPGS